MYKKKKECRFYKGGRCKQGTNCEYIHDPQIQAARQQSDFQSGRGEPEGYQYLSQKGKERKSEELQRSRGMSRKEAEDHIAYGENQLAAWNVANQHEAEILSNKANILSSRGDHFQADDYYNQSEEYHKEPITMLKKIYNRYMHSPLLQAKQGRDEFWKEIRELRKIK